MAGLAELALAHGCSVAGSDLLDGPRTQRLSRLGATVWTGHDARRIDAFQPDLVVYTAAIPEDNPERKRTREKSIPSCTRAAFLGAINREYEQVINIAGTHGKTTTTAMCASILLQSGLDPTVHLGADVPALDASVRVGKPGGIMVSEACEYQRSFLSFYSTTAAILNIDFDHVDCFRDIDDVIDVFACFAGLIPEDGTLILPAFDAHVADMLQRMRQGDRPLPRLVTFGQPEDTLDGKSPDVVCRNIRITDGYPSFDVWIRGTLFTSIQLRVPGEHNIMNALAAIACAQENGATAHGASTALNAFTGAEGRFDIRGSWHGATVVSDYAHHPSAARATLRAAQSYPHKDLWVVFQPLTYSRTRVLFDDFVDALLPAPFTIFAEIFSDRDRGDGTVSSRYLADAINENGGTAVFADDFNGILELLAPRVHSGDLILVLGPEDIRQFADWLLLQD